MTTTPTATELVSKALTAYEKIARENRPDWPAFITDAEEDPSGIAYEVIDHITHELDRELTEEEYAELFAASIAWVEALRNPAPAEQPEEAEEAEEVSQLPAGWRRYSSARLEELLSEFEEPYLTEDDYDEVVEELAGRDREAEQLTGHHHDQLEDQHNERPFP